jgi:2-hydroxy-3-oxopropionate reductase
VSVEATEKPRLGFIGLGIMGKPMARNLLNAGYHVVVHNRSRPAIDALVAEGAASRATPRDVAAACDILITMLPDTPDVAGVYAGDDGAFEALRPGWLAIDMSTISPRVGRELCERARISGAEMLDAPVSGGDKGAIAGTLSIMVGGSERAFERALPVLSALGTTVVRVGDAGTGQIVKACNQVVVAGVIAAVAEGLVLGAKSGVAPEKIVEVLQGGLASTRVLEMRGEKMLSGAFDPGFRIQLHIKDLRIALELAREAGVILPLTAEIEQMMQALRTAGREDYDHSGLITFIEDLAKFRVADAVRAAPQDESASSTA